MCAKLNRPLIYYNQDPKKTVQNIFYIDYEKQVTYGNKESCIRNEHTEKISEGSEKIKSSSVTEPEPPTLCDADEVSAFQDVEELNYMYKNSETLENTFPILESEVIPEYSSEFVAPEGKLDKIIILTPVVLSQFRIEIAKESSHTFQYPIVDINRITKNVCLTQCKLIPDINKLFISGYIRENIEYVALETEKSMIGTCIKHKTVNIPFKCATSIQYLSLPEINKNPETLELEMLNSDSSGVDTTERDFISHEYFTNKIYCELVSAEISELNSSDEVSIFTATPDKMNQTLNEKMVITLTIKLLQNQQVKIHDNN